MIKFKAHLIISSFIFILACSSDSDCDMFFFPASVSVSTDQNTIGIDDTLKILIAIEDSILANTNPVDDATDEILEIAVALQKFKTFEENTTQRLPYGFYENALESFDLEIVNGTLTPTLETPVTGVNPGFLSNTTRFIKPERINSQQIIEFNLKPLEKDTFVIHFIGTSWLTNTEFQNCTSLNRLQFVNNSNADVSLVNSQFVRLAELLEGDFEPDIETRFQEFDGGILLFVE